MDKKQIISERIKYTHPMLHYTENNTRRNRRPFPDVPWHWHMDFEISCVKNGSVVYRTVSKEVLLEPGDAVFINSKVIHSVTPIEPREEVHHISQFFDNGFISGWEGNFFDTKYVMPFQKREDIDIIIMRAGDRKFAKIHELIDKNTELIEKAEKYYEFELRKNVCDIWQIILDSVEGLASEISIPQLPNKRLRNAITYIQKHYNEKITLEDIANTLHVSARECNRMFNKYLKISPINYLRIIRLQKATSMLNDIDKSIEEVALENGYPSSSYFGKIFKESYNITPKEYRELIIKKDFQL